MINKRYRRTVYRVEVLSREDYDYEDKDLDDLCKDFHHDQIVADTVAESSEVLTHEEMQAHLERLKFDEDYFEDDEDEPTTITFRGKVIGGNKILDVGGNLWEVNGSEDLQALIGQEIDFRIDYIARDEAFKAELLREGFSETIVNRYLGNTEIEADPTN